MKRHLCRGLALAAAGALLLFGCAAEPEAPPPEPSAEEAPAPPEPAGEAVPAVYAIPAGGLTLEETAAAYIQQRYLSYRTFEDIDLSAILDTRYSNIRNNNRWTSLLLQRRRLLYENEICYVETEEFPYTIRFLEDHELTDERLEYWERPSEPSDELVHFVVEGEPGKAYPPMLSPGAQHSMLLAERDGVWKIFFHYFPGSIRKFVSSSGLRERSDEEMLAQLREEFGLLNPETPEEPPPLSLGAVPYGGKAAAAYARAYTEAPNPAYYHVGDWLGDCANFSSQCILAGFGGQEHMTSQWYAGEGGGSPAWENVEHFWNAICSGEELTGQILDGIYRARPGDLIQVNSPMDTDGRFSHSLLVVDADALVLAQHSPGCFVYYSDLVNVRTRMIRPLSVQQNQ